MKRRSFGTPSLYILLPVLSAITPLVALPAVTHYYGSPGWAAIAVGQSVGGVCGIVVNYGWLVVGPATVHGTSLEDRPTLYEQSAHNRYVVVLTVAPIAFVISGLLVRDYPLPASLTALSFALSGATASWYFIAIGSPVGMLLYDVAPRLLASMASLILFPLGAGLASLPTVQILFIVCGTALANRKIMRAWVPRRAKLRGIWSNRAPLVASSVLSSGYVGFSVALVALWAPNAVPIFAAAARFRDFGVSALGAIANFLTGSINSAASSAPFRWHARCRSASLLTVVGMLGGLAIALLAPVAARILFSNAVRVSTLSSTLTGAVVAAIAVGLALGSYLLVPAGLQRSVVAAGLAATTVGTPLLVILARSWGADGALCAVLAAETVSASWQAFAWTRYVRSMPGWREREPLSS